jgi:hypothetical protein
MRVPKTRVLPLDDAPVRDRRKDFRRYEKRLKKIKNRHVTANHQNRDQITTKNDKTEYKIFFHPLENCAVTVMPAEAGIHSDETCRKDPVITAFAF